MANELRELTAPQGSGASKKRGCLSLAWSLPHEPGSCTEQLCGPGFSGTSITAIRKGGSYLAPEVSWELRKVACALSQVSLTAVLADTLPQL